jgi:hypothetical protein
LSLGRGEQGGDQALTSAARLDHCPVRPADQSGVLDVLVVQLVGHAVSGEPVDGVGGPGGDHGDQRGVAAAAAEPVDVGDVLFDRVRRHVELFASEAGQVVEQTEDDVGRREREAQQAAGEPAVAAAFRAGRLLQYENPGAGLRGRERGAQGGVPGSHHHHVGHRSPPDS